MRAIVVDDERLIVEHIDRLLAHAGIEVLGGCTNPHEALQLARTLQPDVLFLDIEMPEMSGLEIAAQLDADGMDVEIVFITAFNQYALDAFRVNALDYLLKPVQEEELSRALERVRKRRQAQAAATEGSIRNRRLSATYCGKLSVYVGDSPEPIRWVTAKCAELLAYMLLQRDREAGKWQLFEALWREKDADKADINLRSTVSRINKTLKDLQADAAIVSVKNGYRLSISGAAPIIDVERLERFILDAVEITSVNLEQAEQLFEQCVPPVLAEFDGEWCEPYRSRYRQYVLQLGRRLLAYYENVETEPLRRLRLAEELIELDPFNDALRAEALMLQYGLGGPQEAAAYYEAYAALLDSELGMKPGEALTALLHALTADPPTHRQQPWMSS